MDDQRTDREGGVKGKRLSSSMTIATLILVFLFMPFLLIGIAMAETTILGTSGLCSIYRRIGIFDALLVIHDTTATLFKR